MAEAWQYSKLTEADADKLRALIASDAEASNYFNLPPDGVGADNLLIPWINGPSGKTLPKASFKINFRALASLLGIEGVALFEYSLEVAQQALAAAGDPLSKIKSKGLNRMIKLLEGEQGVDMADVESVKQLDSLAKQGLLTEGQADAIKAAASESASRASDALGRHHEVTEPDVALLRRPFLLAREAALQAANAAAALAKEPS